MFKNTEFAQDLLLLSPVAFTSHIYNKPVHRTRMGTVGWESVACQVLGFGQYDVNHFYMGKGEGIISYMVIII